MNKLVLLLLLLINVYSSFGQQNSHPIHSNWYYGCKSIMSWYNDLNTKHLLYIKDTVVKGKICSQIEGQRFDCIYSPEKFYLYEDNKSVYFYFPQLDTFELLYNYNATKGYQYKVIYSVLNTSQDTLQITIDSVGSRIINNKTLKTFSVTYSTKSSCWGWTHYSSTIIENIGDESFFFNLQAQCMVCDGNWSTGLRCYEDSLVGLYKTDTLVCDYNTGIEQIEKQTNNLLIFPNPADDKIFIKQNPMPYKYSYSILTLAGQVVSDGDFKDFINVSALSRGLYVLKLKDNFTNETKYKKIIKK